MSNVFVRRSVNTSGLPDDYVDKGKSKVGSCASGDAPLTGLSDVEIEAYMPKIIGISVNSNDFMPKVHDYFWNIGFEIPAGNGLKLNRTLEEGKYTTVRGEQVPVPVDVKAYVRYKYLLGYPDCANTEEESLGGGYRMFLFDEETKVNKDYDKLKLRKLAQAEYLRISTDPELTDMVLSLLGEDINELDEKGKDLALERFAQNVPESFTAKAKDKNLTWKAKIQKMLTKRIIERVGNTFMFGNLTLGNHYSDLDPYREVVVFLKDGKNSETLVRLFAHLGEEAPQPTAKIETE